MAKSPDAAKERYWRRLIRRQATSGLGTRGFCEREGIPESRFWWWRRTLRERDGHSARPARRMQVKRPVSDSRRNGVESPFLAVPLSMSLATSIEIVHPRGHVLRVPVCFDASVLRRILATLDTPADSSEERS